MTPSSSIQTADVPEAGFSVPLPRHTLYAVDLTSLPRYDLNICGLVSSSIPSYSLG